MAFLLLNVVAFFALSKPTVLKGYILAPKLLKKHHSFMVADSHGRTIQQSDLAELGICNFSYDSDSYFDMLVKIDHLLKNYRIDTLFLTVDDHALSKYREWWTNRERSIYYSSFELHKKFYHTPLPEFVFKKYMEYYLPLFSTKNAKLFNSYLDSKITGKAVPNYENYDFSKVPSEKRIERSIDRIKSQYPKEGDSDFLRRCLNEIIARCQQKNVEIIGIRYPLTREFIDELGDRNYRADSVLEVNGYKVIDLKNCFPDSIAYFRDQDHVNLTGSKEFVKRLKEQL